MISEITLLSLNSRFKIPKWGIVDPKFKEFFFFFALKFELRQILGRWFQIWEYYFQILAQKYTNKEFLVPNLRIFWFCTKLCNKTNLRELISNTILFFQNCSPKYLNKAFLVPNLRIFIFDETLQQDKFEVYNFQYDNSFRQFCS